MSNGGVVTMPGNRSWPLAALCAALVVSIPLWAEAPMGTSGAGTSTAVLDATYLRVDASNDPVTGELALNAGFDLLTGSGSVRTKLFNPVGSLELDGTVLMDDGDIVSDVAAGATAFVFDDTQASGSAALVEMKRNGSTEYTFGVGGAIAGAGNSLIMQPSLSASNPRLTVSAHTITTVVPFNFQQRVDRANDQIFAVTSNSGALTSSSTVQEFAAFEPEVDQTSTAGYTALAVDVTETATGSGAKSLMDLKVGGTSQFSVSNAGDLGLLGAISDSGGDVILNDNVSITGDITTVTDIFLTASGVLRLGRQAGDPCSAPAGASCSVQADVGHIFACESTKPSTQGSLCLCLDDGTPTTETYSWHEVFGSAATCP